MEPAATSSALVRAIVLAGGTARRLGGVDKLALTVGGIGLLDRVLTPLAALCWPTVVVGPCRALAAGLPEPVWAREHPAGGGPAAALAAGLAVPAPATALVAVLAGDLPHLSADSLRAVAAAAAQAVAGGDAGALAVDDGGTDQLLLGVWSETALRSAASCVRPGASLRSVLSPLRFARVVLAGVPAPWSDCDTDADLARARAAVTAAAR